MEEQITLEEIKKAIEELSIGKSPGPDGLTNVYYKKYNDILSIPLCDYFNKI